MSLDSPSIPSSFALLDLSLFKHYIFQTSPTFSRNEKVTHIYTHVISDLACKHAYLMHALLAIAALHKFTLNPHDHALLASATSHLDLALAIGHPVIAALSRSSADPVMAYSALVSTYFFALPVCEPRGILFDPIDKFVDMIAFMRQNSAVAIGAKQWIRDGPLWPLLGIDHPRDPQFDPAGEVSKTFRWLESHLLSFSYDSEETKTALLENATDLRNTAAAAILARPPLEFSRVFRWPAMTPPEVRELFRSRHPGALSVLACWCPCLKRSQESWLSGNWRDSITAAIGSYLIAQQYPWATQLDEAVRSIDKCIAEQEALFSNSR